MEKYEIGNSISPVIPLRNEERMIHGNLLNDCSRWKSGWLDKIPKSQTFYAGFRMGMTNCFKRQFD